MHKGEGKKKNWKCRFILRSVLSMVTVCALMAVSGLPACAGTARATTMKLEKTEGTVTLKTQNGTERKIKEGMRLYNGNAIATASGSYAYISLDSSKAVKLDEKSSATLRQSGKRLELLVKSGKLFFDVSTPLTEKESMNIRTSTMVTGVRGTCGVVEYVTRETSKLYLLEGQVTLGDGNGTTTIYGGQVATVQITAETEPEVTVNKMTEADVPIFAIEEILNNTELQKKIEKTTDLSVEKMKKVLEEIRQSADPENPDEPGNGETEPTNPTNPIKPYYPTHPSDPTPVATPSELTGTVTVAAAQKSLDAEENTKITLVQGATLNMKESDSITIPAGKTLVVNGSIVGEGTIHIGDEKGASSMTVAAGGVIMGAAPVLANGSSLINNGTVESVSLSSAGNATITNNGLIKLAGAYTCAGGMQDTYICEGDGVLISAAESTGMQEGTLLFTRGQNEYVYAKGLNATVAAYLHELSQYSDVAVVFQKNANVETDVTMRVAPEKKYGIQMLMGDYTLCVKSGTLTLASDVSVTGSGDATISLQDDGRLVLGETGMESKAGTVLENTKVGGTVIMPSRDVMNQADVVMWNDAGLAIMQTQGGVANTIYGAGCDEDSIFAQMPVYVTVAGVPLYDDSGNCLYLPPSELTGSVTTQYLQAALETWDTVTIGADAETELGDTEMLQIPDGKTLVIESQIEFKGTLEIGDNAALTIGEEAGLSCQKIVLGESALTNRGIINATEITSVGKAKVFNFGEIRLIYGYCLSENATGDGDYYEDQEDSMLVSGMESTAMPEEKLLVSDLETRYIYANRIDSNVMAEMGSSTMTFYMDAEVFGTVTASAINWDMGTHALKLSSGSEMTLEGYCNITGNGERVVYLDGGKLNLSGEGGYIQNTNPGEDYVSYAIAVSNASDTEMNWNDTGFMIQSYGSDDSGGGVIENLTQGAIPAYLKYPDGYSLCKREEIEDTGVMRTTWYLDIAQEP